MIEKIGLEKMRRSKGNKFVRKPVLAAASLAFCLCLTGVTVLASTGKLQGFFKDVKRWDGALIGTTYEQTTDEIEMRIVEAAEEIVLEISMIDPSAAPYCFFEMFGVADYKIVDNTGKIIAEENETHMEEVADGKAVVYIPLNDLSAGEYQLVVTELTGSSKADQPLVLSGTWKIKFEK